ncbi:pentatricopeptide repeat-containing protein At3g22150, chloroplastic [Nicotiana sylvestris]|uniref:Pentatricopeptide repeat-containing protein At3g22150, chloroplastic n=1 Tax=Nicotiana sylvestris TaxID=4096 RepID=A0A1U7V4H6_NICSY|nr:PREDICTED: pentatricopeptide repeat-containing protein At3g22150, chloroplastic [Nicotiana sylvestris]XP_009759869.1 PREDICTED: pentatricopeptide repeat-containing protein At3g22150, chloroplastic [Nicotiana sylvestris]XP_009759870.1 PREDICTED: pentatricopeptide repeat-containing protein At3g22150, chloroplastic [Nicotiana sylvestris]XP_009759872.1 PREDICTED: pentatricopeptide repeat-containing protein At3g22150, chloroplastic [Nicotiana sylvestris]XP_009759873.1 PREDICTED: pentatricopeptide
MRLTMSSSALPLPLPFSSSTFSQSPASLTLTHHPNFSSLLHSNTLTDEQQCTVKNESKPRTIRYRLGELCRQGLPHLARQLFDTIPQPSTVLWNTIIIGFICNNLSHEAISFYSRLKHVGSSTCDQYTYSSVLKACAETKRILVGKAVHCHILRSGIHPSRIVCNSLLNMYSTCLEFENGSRCDLVERVFRTMRKRNAVAWNTIFSWYVKRKRFSEAVRCFVMMMRIGIKPTVVSFVNIFPAVSEIGDVRVADVLYGSLVKLGNEYVNDLFVVSAAIVMYADLGCIDLASRIFENSCERNTEIWNSMISGYIQNNFPFKALDLFLGAVEAEDGVPIDDVTFVSALTATSQLQHLEFAQQLHACLIKKSMDSQVILLNAMVATYSRCNRVGDSFKVFSGMEERDIVSWNTMVSALVQNGLDDEALMLVHEMQKLGVVIDAITITILLSAASNLRDRKIGKQTHAYLLRHNIQFEGMESYLIDMYAKSSMIREAQAIFQSNCTNDKDQATWNSMIAGNTQNGLIEQSFVVFKEMLEQNVKPNAVTLASLLPACSQSGSIAIGKQLHCFAIRNLFENNVYVVSALVDMYSKSGSIHYAESIFLKSPEKNSVTYTNMILGYGQHGMGKKALALFYSLRENGLKPDAVTFVAILSACSYTGLVDEGLQIFELMDEEYGIQPSAEHYACVVDMLGRVGRLDEAHNFAKQLGEEGNVLGIWGSLLAACRVHRNFELGKIVSSKLIELEGSDRISGYHVLLSNIYAEEGNWQSVDNVRRGMRKMGLSKEVGCSWIGTSGYPSCFVSRDRKHPQSDMIYDMLGHLTINMKDVGYKPNLEPIEEWMYGLQE